MQVLSSVQALQPGADLWIMAIPSDSHWSRQVDWYLNFQISRGLQTKIPERSMNLEKLLHDVQWTLPESFIAKENPLLIAAAGRLPARWVLLPQTFDVSLSFLEKASQLQPGTVRLFLPPSIAKMPLPKQSFAFELEVVHEN